MELLTKYHNGKLVKSLKNNISESMFVVNIYINEQTVSAIYIYG